MITYMHLTLTLYYCEQTDNNEHAECFQFTLHQNCAIYNLTRNAKLGISCAVKILSKFCLY